VSIENSIFELNEAGTHGGGIFLSGSATGSLKKIRFQNNYANKDGGGVAISTVAVLSLYSV